MSRPASLGRLREISRQRSIRRPLLVPLPAEDRTDVPESTVEWPIPAK